LGTGRRLTGYRNGGGDVMDDSDWILTYVAICVCTLLIVGGIVALYKNAIHEKQKKLEKPSKSHITDLIQYIEFVRPDLFQSAPAMQIQNPQNVFIPPFERKDMMKVIEHNHTCSICGRKLVIEDAMGIYTLHCPESIYHDSGPWCDSPEEAVNAFVRMIQHNVQKVER
jgi:ribosomal protein L37AE/L43A